MDLVSGVHVQNATVTPLSLSPRAPLVIREPSDSQALQGRTEWMARQVSGALQVC